MTVGVDGLLARRVAAGDDTPVRLVTVCLGNICRSPMAKSVLRSKVRDAGLEGRIEVDSAGTSGWHVGGPADPRAAQTLSRHGYDPTHTARRFTGHDLVDFDLVLVADHANLHDVTDLARTPDEVARVALLRSFDPSAPAEAEIPDPYHGGERGFEEVLGMIERACDGLLDRLTQAP